MASIVDAETGAEVNTGQKRGRPDEMVEVIVVGNAHYQHEPDADYPDQPEAEWPLKRYKKGARLRVTRRTLRDSNGSLRDVNKVGVSAPAPLTVTDVSGIGRGQARQLATINIHSLEALAKADSRQVAQTIGVSEKRAAELIQEASDLVESEADEMNPDVLPAPRRSDAVVGGAMSQTVKKMQADPTKAKTMDPIGPSEGIGRAPPEDLHPAPKRSTASTALSVDQVAEAKAESGVRSG